MVKSFHLSLCLLMCLLFSVVASSCSKDDEPDSSSKSSIVGTWFYEEDVDEGYFDTYTLVFAKDNTGYIRNDFGSRGSTSEQMNFDWSLNLNSQGQYLLSVIYKSGDRDMDGPFQGGYAQYNRAVTIAGNTLSIQTSDNTVMLFSRK